MNKRSFIFLVVILLGMTANVLAQDWPNFRKDSLHTARVDELFQPPLSVKWKFKAQGKIVSSPAVIDGRVYIGSRDNNLYALDKDTGTLLWKFKTGGWVDSSPALNKGKVYFSSKDGNLYCLDADKGSLIWKYQTKGADCSSPVLGDNKVFSASGFPNKFIYAVNAENGEEVWRKDTQQMVYSSPALSKDKVYIGSNDGNIYCLDKDKGDILWKYHTTGGVYFSSPAIEGGRLYIATGNFDWSVYALDLESGKLIWKYVIEDKKPTPNYVSSPALGDGKIFIVAGYTQQYLYCLDSKSGKLIWKKELSSASRLGFSSSPVVTQDTVYVASAEGKLKAFEIATGRLVWEYDLGEDVLSSLAISEGMLFIATFNGTLYAFE